jgi:hypothetical protein
MIHEKIYAVCILFCIYDTRLFGELPVKNKILGFHEKKKSFFLRHITFIK